MYIAAGLFGMTLLLQACFFIYSNGLFRYHSSRAQITQAGGAVRIRLSLQHRLRIKEGQYINLWMPSISFWSFTQSHPFVVISWAAREQDSLDLFIEPRRGLTQHLLHHAKARPTVQPRVMFSGPHGQSIAMEKYETVLMVASGFGIAAQLPYLKRLIHGYNSREVFARRIHLVWQIDDKGKAALNCQTGGQAYKIRGWNRGSIASEWCTGGG
jgi:NAD(P)H-flavin reductase